jgi:mono/diheme cytochrome c family protein
MNWLIVLPLLAVLVGLRFLRPNALVWSLAWIAVLWAFFRFGFDPPVPQSLVRMYLGIALIAVFAYSTSSRERREATYGPIVRLAVEPRFLPLLVAIMVAIPAAAAFNVYRSMSAPLEAPAFGRTVHPAPPDSITVHGNTVDLIHNDNPFLRLEKDEPAEFARRVANGRTTYYSYCHYCHGDNMAGNGMFAHGLNPIPTDFTDSGVLPNFQSTYFFWRISKGGPGLPDEGGPWNSAMPAWENFLTEEQIWEVVTFLYDYNDFEPRALHEALH